jgi:hypothetical protein
MTNQETRRDISNPERGSQLLDFLPNFVFVLLCVLKGYSDVLRT